MGTFHDDKGELHGITVAVDTRGKEILVGRCDTITNTAIILNDADVHEDGAGGKSKADYLKRAAMFGVFKKHDRVAVPLDEVTSIKRLSEASDPSARDYAEGFAHAAPAPAAAKAEGATATATATKTETAKQVVELTESAQAEVKRLVEAEAKAKPGVGLRLGVKGGGCSGLSYKLEFDTKKDGDTVIPYPGFSVFLDKKSTIYLRGVKLDHQKGLAGKGFVFHNPNATNTCGCGESFSV